MVRHRLSVDINLSASLKEWESFLNMIRHLAQSAEWGTEIFAGETDRFERQGVVKDLISKLRTTIAK